MSINPERYTDGYSRPNLKIEFRPTADIAATILTSAELGLGEEIGELTKAGAEKVIRNGLQRHGIEHWYFAHEGYAEEGEGEWEEVYGRAREAIERWWPTWNFESASEFLT
jgi:hypothetical protein